MEAVNLDVWLTVNPQTVPVDAEALRPHFPGHYPHLERIKTEGVGHPESMEDLLLKLLWGICKPWVFPRATGRAGRTDQWPTGAGLLNMYERWFGETVRLLELAGYLQRDRVAPHGQ